MGATGKSDVLQRLKRGQAATRTAHRAVSSGGEAKHPIDELVLCSDVTLLHPPNLSLPNLVHRLVPLNGPSRTTEPTKMLLGRMCRKHLEPLDRSARPCGPGLI
jgi:hypothetical protein